MLLSIKASFDFRHGPMGQFNESRLNLNARDVIPHGYELEC